MFTGNNFKYKRSKVLCSCFVIFLFTLLLMGCAQTKQTMPKQPIKPILETTENPKDERGICLDADNTYLLLDYIWQLEEGYNQ